jgi:hypothetical protein
MSAGFLFSQQNLFTILTNRGYSISAHRHGCRQNTVDTGACSDGGIVGLLGEPAGALTNVSSNAGTQ